MNRREKATQATLQWTGICFMSIFSKAQSQSQSLRQRCDQMILMLFSLLTFSCFLPLNFTGFVCGERGKKWQKMHERRLNEGDSLLTCEGKKAGMDFASLLCICQNSGRGRVAIGNVEGSFSPAALWLWAGGVKHICMSVITPAWLSANTDAVQTRKVHYHSPLCDCLSLSLCHPVTYRSILASKRACAHARLHFDGLVPFLLSVHSILSVCASVCVCVSVCFRQTQQKFALNNKGLLKRKW